MIKLVAGLEKMTNKIGSDIKENNNFNNNKALFEKLLDKLFIISKKIDLGGGKLLIEF